MSKLLVNVITCHDAAFRSIAVSNLARLRTFKRINIFATQTMTEVLVHDNSMYAIARMLRSANRPGVLVTRRKVRDQLATLPGFDRLDLRLIPDNPSAAESVAEMMLANGWYLLLCWETVLSLEKLSRPGEAILPTRIVDSESLERYDTALHSIGRRNHAALLSTPTAPEISARRRLAMRHQCVGIDRICATLARTMARADAPILVVCALIDTRADIWANRLLLWTSRFGRRNPLTWIGVLLFKPREFWTHRLSRNKANIELDVAIGQLKECLLELEAEPPDDVFIQADKIRLL